MNLKGITNFIRTNWQFRRICIPVYNQKLELWINDLLDQVKRIGNHYGESMVLIPSDDERKFFLSYSRNYGFTFTEESNNPAVTILGWSEKLKGQVLIFDLTELRIKDLLKDLFNHGYLNGEYHPL